MRRVWLLSFNVDLDQLRRRLESLAKPSGKTYLTAMTMQTKLSAKGQVVIPKDVRDRLGLIEGMVFDVIEREGEIVLKKEGVHLDRMAAADALREIQSFYRYDGPPVSIKEMKEAARKAAVEHFLRKQSR